MSTAIAPALPPGTGQPANQLMARSSNFGGALITAQAMQSVFATNSSTTTTLTSYGGAGSNYFLTGSGGLNNYNVHLKKVDADGDIPLAEGRYKLPDGTIIEVDAKGDTTVTDPVTKKVTHRANPNREFNPFINASDLLADFIRDLGGLGVTNDKIMRVPLDFYIHWLVVRAAQADGDEVPEHRCLTCGRFLAKDKWRIGACNQDHLFKFKEKRAAA